MAESTILYTPGAGGKIHSFNRTIGANAVEDEVVLLGENYLPSYVGGIFNVSTATANSHLIQIMAGASLKQRIRKLEMYQTALATVAQFMTLQVFRLTTAGTGGGVVGLVPLNPGDAAFGGTCMTLPTAKGTEGNGIDTSTAYMVQTAGASSYFGQPIWTLDLDRLRSQPLITAAGTANGICIKNVTAVAAGTVSIRVIVDESNF